MAINLANLRERQQEILSEMDKLIEAADPVEGLSAEEQEKYEGLKAEFDKNEQQISLLSEHDSRKAAVQQVKPAAARRAIAPIRGPEAKKEFESAEEFIHAVTFNQNDQRLQYADFSAELSSSEGVSGGFLIPPQISQRFLMATPQDAVIMSRAQQLPAGDPPDAELPIPALEQGSSANMFGGVELTWTNLDIASDGSDIASTSPSFRQIVLKPNGIAGTIGIPNQLLVNWQAAGSLLVKLLNGALIHAFETSFLSGDGVKKPQGILNAPSTLTYNRAGSNAIAIGDVAGMLGKFVETMGMPVWLYSQTALPKLIQLADAAGHLLWVNSVQQGEPATLMGIPAIKNRRNPALGTKGDLILADLQSYLVKPGSGPFLAVSEHAEFKKNRTVYKIVANIDAQSWLKAPLLLENGVTTASPVVVLDVPSLG